MTLTLRELLARVRDAVHHPRSRALELAELRARLALAPGPGRLPGRQVERARRLLALREELAAALGDAQSCGTCGRGHDAPQGRWDGGFCCSGRTEEIFDDVEVAVLRAGGVEGRHLAAPRGDHAGCAFRGPTGCSLPPAHRPGQCLRYACSELRRELGRSGRLGLVDALAERLRAEHEAFAAEREARRENEAWRLLEKRCRRWTSRPLGPG